METRDDPLQRRVSARHQSLRDNTIQFRRNSSLFEGSSCSGGESKDLEDVVDLRPGNDANRKIETGSLGSLGSASGNDSDNSATLTPWQASGADSMTKTKFLKFFPVRGSRGNPGTGRNMGNQQSGAKRAGDQSSSSKWTRKHWAHDSRRLSFDESDGAESFSRDEGFSSESADGSSSSRVSGSGSGSSGLWDRIETSSKLVTYSNVQNALMDESVGSDESGAESNRREGRSRRSISARRCARATVALAAVVALAAFFYLVADENSKSMVETLLGGKTLRGVVRQT